MNEREALERLGAIHAIAPDYYDIWGQRHAVSDASYVALLGALGVHARTPQEVEAAISAAELERLHGVLPPVIVVRERGWRRGACA